VLVCPVDELLLQLYAVTIWKFVVGIAIITVIAIIAPNAKLNLCIISEILPTIKAGSLGNVHTETLKAFSMLEAAGVIEKFS
jgi:hypothetical protein